MRTETRHDAHGKEFKITYDDNAPCIICGEPVIAASVGGTHICGACDCGRCRYCGIGILVLKEEIDEGRSKKRLLEHMAWHKTHTPDVVEQRNNGLRRLMDILEKEPIP